jgi:glycosyltransferase involved in cell wall biosynthesis
MKLAYWYPASTFSAWSISLGAVDALRRMGHEVVDCGIVAGTQSLNQSDYPSLAELDAMDGILISGPEHMRAYITALYPEWEKVKTRKAAWMHETVQREDYGTLNVENIKRLADVVFCPAVQDEAYGFKFLPFGVDTEVFRPEPAVARDISVCFIGLMYPKRSAYLARVREHLREIELKLGNVEVKAEGKVDARKTVLAYAEVLRRIKVFVNLPTLSQLLVTKIYEVAASGACLVTPTVKGIAERNHLFVRDNICLYNEDDPAALAASVKSLLGDDQKRSGLAQRAAAEMYSEHRIELRLQKILDALA